MMKFDQFESFREIFGIDLVKVVSRYIFFMVFFEDIEHVLEIPTIIFKKYPKDNEYYTHNKC